MKLREVIKEKKRIEMENELKLKNEQMKLLKIKTKHDQELFNQKFAKNAFNEIEKERNYRNVNLINKITFFQILLLLQKFYEECGKNQSYLQDYHWKNFTHPGILKQNELEKRMDVISLPENEKANILNLLFECKKKFEV